MLRREATAEERIELVEIRLRTTINSALQDEFTPAELREAMERQMAFVERLVRDA